MALFQNLSVTPYRTIASYPFASAVPPLAELPPPSSNHPFAMWLLAVLVLLAVTLVVLKPAASRRLQSLNRRLRLSDDLYLVPLLKSFFNHYVVQSLITKRFSLWYEFESIVDHAPGSIALQFVRPIGSFRESGDAAFSVERLTYRELYNCILRMSFILKHEMGVEKGTRVSLIYMNKPLFVIIWFALWNIGAVPAFINYNLTKNPLLHCIKIVNSQILLIDDDCRENYESTRNEISREIPNLKTFIIEEKSTMAHLTNPSSKKFRQLDKIRDAGVQYWDPALLIYTSGTTGLPKSAVNSWRKVFMATHLFPRVMHIDRNSNIYTAMPIYHGTASILGVLPALFSGGTISIGLKFSVSSYWTQVKLANANSIQYVGEVCRYLVDSNETFNEREMYGKLKLAFGNGLRPDIWMKLKERFGIPAIGEFYASSEAPFATSCYEYDGHGVGAIRNNGWLVDKFLSLQYTLVKMDPNDDTTIYRNARGFCEEPGVNEKGEMLMRVLNPSNIKATFPGYVNDDHATYSKVVRDVFRKGDAYIRSDDLMRKDEFGCIYFVDRMGDTYRWKSENVSTTEVENELLHGVPHLKNCVVVGCRVPNHEGRAGYLLAQTVDDNRDIKDVQTREKLLQEISTTSQSRLPPYARPLFVTFHVISLNDSHKISKKVFRDPILPRGKEGNIDVYFWDPHSGKYMLLTEEKLNDIANGKIRV
ncbi:Very long-chain fatty acid transport protein [Pichia kudriavzevii]|uniref:Very long-chain fatty acid transport protein n=1 Tax=Pichia kudriavzevii TaxID=4909 RepID=A0A1V2LGI4_PICKU|nr:Very long-chain fatty acid transport protein [Pichia kudriavzevii]